jgi:redox-sensitive bicupin YhaK (pirin superfamily)
VGTRLDRHPAAARFRTATDGIASRHAFSYGTHYDPANVRFGLLLAHNDELLAPGAGYDEHRHRGVDILSWVVSGALRHEDDLGAVTVISPGTVQRLSAGTGVRHSERNASSAPTRYVQMWIEPGADGPPEYGTAEFAGADFAGAGFVTLVSGRSPAALAIGAPASFVVARLGASEVAAFEGAAFVHLALVRGTAEIAVDGDTVVMDDGDTARITDAGQIVVRADRDAEVLGWVMDRETRRPG